MNHKAWGFVAQFNFWRYRERAVYSSSAISKTSQVLCILLGNRLKAVFWGFVAWRKSGRTESLFLGHVMVQGLSFNEKNFSEIFNKPK